MPPLNNAITLPLLPDGLFHEQAAKEPEFFVGRFLRLPKELPFRELARQEMVEKLFASGCGLLRPMASTTIYPWGESHPLSAMASSRYGWVRSFSPCPG